MDVNDAASLRACARDATQSSAPAQSSVLTCESLAQWQLFPVRGFQGVRVHRPVSPECFQSVVDGLARSGLLDLEYGALEAVEAQGAHRADFRQVADRLLAPLTLPMELQERIAEDACAIGERLQQLLPLMERFLMKLEVVGENNCSKWHVDNYVCRTIVTYNCVGTEYLEQSNVDFWELKNCGEADCIIRNKNEIYQASVGDFLFMKGEGFPEDDQRGLVHRSPDLRHHADGSVMHRLCLKVDVPVHQIPRKPRRSMSAL